MGIRQALNENPVVGTIATSAIIVVTLLFIFWHMHDGHRTQAHVPGKMFYSDDDGKTYFPDEPSKMTPFSGPHGRPAARAMVVRCGDGAPFVAYLSRDTDEGRKVIEKLAMEGKLPGMFGPNPNLVEVKKPGARSWIKFDPKNPQPYIDVTMARCPGGGSNFPRPVFPPP